MSYGKATLLKSSKILSERRSTAQSIQNARHAEVIAALPEIEKYEAALSASGLAVVKALGMGADASKYIDELSKVNLSVQQDIRKLLTASGYPADYLEVPYTCKKCEDTGFCGGYSCECRKALLKSVALARLEAVSPSKNCRFDNFDPELYPVQADPAYGVSPQSRMREVLEYCRCYADDFDKSSDSLFMHGATGLGKTHLSLAIANVVVERGFEVIYTSAQNLMSSLEKEKFGGGNGEREKEILECDLLIIDDLGSEFSTQFTVSAVYNIINTRINLGKPVIISTNLTGEELEAKYTQRITSRIIGSYVSLLFMGRDIRQIKQ